MAARTSRLPSAPDDDVRNSVSFKKDEALLPGLNFRFFASLRF